MPELRIKLRDASLPLILKIALALTSGIPGIKTIMKVDVFKFYL
jgi:hypothetical protein